MQRGTTGILHYLQIIFLHCYVVQGDGRNEHAHRSQEIDNENELQELSRTPDGLKKLPNEKKTNCAAKNLLSKYHGVLYHRNSCGLLFSSNIR